MNYGFKDNCSYFHSALEGKKNRYFKESNNVCFEVDVRNELVVAEEACSWTMKYKSIIGYKP